MKITPKILSIPPFISTSWENISSLHICEKSGQSALVVALNDGVRIEIPNMTQGEIDEIFQAHAHYSESTPATAKNPIDNSFSFSLPINQEEGSTLDTFGAQMQHNPEQSDLPPLPKPVLEKIGSIVRAFGLEDSPLLGNTEENCNCIYCQLSRSLQKEPEEIVDDADLTFRDWEVSAKGEKLYHVVNPLDANEYYNVFLGDPIGCTCGSKNCEHIRSALNIPLVIKESTFEQD